MYRYLLAASVSSVLLMSACGPAVRVVHEEWPSGVARRDGTLVDGRQEGEWTYHDSQGRREAVGGYRHDLQDGTWTWFHADGRPRLTGAYAAGLRSGPWIQYGTDGTVEAAGAYDRDRADGLWRYASAGAPTARGWYELGVRHGAWLTWRDGRPAGGPRWRGLVVGPQLTATGVVDAGAPAGFQAESRVVDGLGVWLLRDAAGTEVLAWVHADGHPRLLRVRTGTGEVIARWDAQDVLLVAGRRGHDGPLGTWLLARDGVETAVAAVPIASVPGAAAPDLVTESARVPEAVTAAAAGFDAEALRLLTAVPPPPVQTVPATPVDAGSSKTVAVGIALAAPVPASADQLDAAPAPATAPLAVVPGFWTAGEKQAAAGFVARYTRGSDDIDSYGSSAGNARTNRPDLVGKPLPQTRFIAADGKVLDLDAWRGKPVVVVVMRGFSGQVCLYCATQTTAIANSIGQFTDLGAQVLVVYPGPVEALPAFVAAVQGLRKDPPPMPLALDPALLLVRSLGIEGNLAKPSSFVLDAGGTVRFAYVGKTIADRPTVEDLLGAVRRAEAR